MPDPLQSALVAKALARDAGQSIGALDPRTTNTYMDREDPFSTPDLMHKAMDTVGDFSNFGHGALGAGAAMGSEAIGSLKMPEGLMEKLMGQLPTNGISETLAERMRPKAWYEGMTSQPKPGTALYSALEKLGEIAGTGGKLAPSEHKMLDYFTGLIR